MLGIKKRIRTARQTKRSNTNTTAPIQRRPMFPCASLSAAGTRETNQDRAIALVVQLTGGEQFSLAAISDGMGGHEGGERAAELAIETVVSSLATHLVNGKTIVPDGAERLLRSAVQCANRRVQRDGDLHQERKDMGATITVGLIIRDDLFVANLGDSRLYVYQDGGLKGLTQDDSLVRRLVNTGALEEEQAAESDMDNVVTHALGKGEDLGELRVTRHRLLPGDIVMAVSDGFWKFAENDTAEVLSKVGEHSASDALQTSVQTLVEMALEQGSDDNVSVALLRHEGRGQPDQQNGGSCDGNE